MSARNPFREPRPERVPYVTFALCFFSAALCMGWWLTGAHPDTWGHVSPERLWSGDLGGLITTTFLHAPPLQNPFHLIFNLLWMARLGAVAERVLGRLEFAVFCGLASVLSTGSELAFSQAGSIGLSGVVYALFGLAWAARRSVSAFQLVATQDTVNYMVGWFFLCIALTMFGNWNVANVAHGAGLIFGGAVGWLFLSDPIPVRFKAAAAAALALLTVLTVLSVTYLPWSPRWQYWRATAGNTVPLIPE